MALSTSFAIVQQQMRRAAGLVWSTSPALMIGLVLATLVAGLLPALAAWLGQRIVDAVVAAMRLHAEQGQAPLWPVLKFVLAEAGVLAPWREPSGCCRCSNRYCGYAWGRP